MHKGSLPQGPWLGSVYHAQVHGWYHPHSACPEGELSLNAAYVNHAVLWFTINKMIPNVDKTKHMVISFHKQHIVIPPIPLEGVEIGSTGGWMVRALVCQADGRVFESNQWLSFDFQILSYLLRFKIRVSTLCASFRTSHSWAYSPVTAVWSPSGQLAGCGLDYGCGRRRTMSIPVRLRAAILCAKRSYSCSSDCLVLRLCQLLSSIYD